MEHWKTILYDIYSPEIGSIWAAPNGIWKNSFALNKSENDFHPSLVGKVNEIQGSCKIVPGTSKNYRKGSCVFKVKIDEQDSECILSYFLIDLWMTFNTKELIKLNHGWNGIEHLSEHAIKEFKMQIKFCHGIDV